MATYSYHILIIGNTFKIFFSETMIPKAYIFGFYYRDLVCNYEQFSKKNLFKSFVEIELSYVFTINMFSTAANCMEK